MIHAFYLLRKMVLASCLCPAILSVTHAEEPAYDLIEPLKVFEPLTGKTWSANLGQTPQGEPIIDVSRFEIALHGRAVRSAHAFTNGAYGGESIIIWDADAQSIVAFYFTTAGFHTRSEMRVDGNRICSTEEVSGNAQGITHVDSTIEYTEGGDLRIRFTYRKGDEVLQEGERLYRESPGAEVNLQ